MRDYRKLLQEYNDKHIIQHKWGQNAINLFNCVAKLWNKINVDEKIAVLSQKKLGVKRVIQVFRENGIDAKII
ncbi:MAG: hypothetical protein GF347_01670, partial [Candidatus Moranbacteria bacterium]|nr:hypothetical protein [Candidatus Moranbacteria bacterium]